MQGSLHRLDAELEQQGNFLQRIIQHVLENHTTALRGRQLEEARHRGAHGLLAREHALWPLIVVRELDCDLNGFAHSSLIAPQAIKRPVVRDAKEPRAQGWNLFELRELVISTRQTVLDDILALCDRAHHARAVAQQIGPHLGNKGEEFLASFL